MTETDNQDSALINSDREAYLSYRQSLDNAEVEVSGRYDKWILTLSGGALGLSITFLEKIAPTPNPETVWLLTFSWVLFVASILAALISLLTSQSAIREMRNSLDNGHDLKPSKCFGIITNFLNWASAFLFVLGAAAFCFFTLKNLPPQGENYVQTETQYPTKSVDRRFCAPCPSQYSWFCPTTGSKTSSNPEPNTQPTRESTDRRIGY